MRRGTQLNKIKLLVFLQLFFLNLPLTLYLAYFVELNNTTTSSKAASQNHLFQFSHSYVLHSLKKGLGHFVFVLMFIWQASSSFNLIYTYGVMSFMLSPAKSWSLILVLYLFWRVHRPRMRQRIYRPYDQSVSSLNNFNLILNLGGNEVIKSNKLRNFESRLLFRAFLPGAVQMLK